MSNRTVFKNTFLIDGNGGEPLEAVYVHRATRNLETDLSLGFTPLRDAGGLDWGFRDKKELHNQ